MSARIREPTKRISSIVPSHVALRLLHLNLPSSTTGITPQRVVGNARAEGHVKKQLSSLLRRAATGSISSACKRAPMKSTPASG